MRRATRRLSTSAVGTLSDTLVRALTPVARLAGRIPSPKLRKVVRAGLPVASYWGELPLESRLQVEWSRLDTRDWLTPAFDLPTTYKELRAVLFEEGASDVRRRDDVGGLTLLVTRSGS